MFTPRLVPRSSIMLRAHLGRPLQACKFTLLSSKTSRHTASQRGPKTGISLNLSHRQYLYQSKRATTNAAAPNTSPQSQSQSQPPIQTPEPSPLSYQPPTKGLISALPAPLIPYAELSRLDKPAGSIYLFFPCLFSTLLAAPLTDPISPPLTVLGTSTLFLTGALIMRGAGCTINDFWDRNLDPYVARTRLRPIARGAVKPLPALVYFSAQCLLGLAVLLQFPTICLVYGIPSLLLVCTYPLAKRITYYPQVVLGTAFSWGAIMGFPALGLDVLSEYFVSAGCLYASCVAWTVLYDMIYAHMDIKDDVKVGIKSIALRHEQETKKVLSGLAVLQVSLLAAAGWAAGAGPVFFVGSCGSAAVSLAVMIARVELKSVGSCWWWFRNGCWFTGGGISLGLAGEYLAHLWSAEGDEKENGKAQESVVPE